MARVEVPVTDVAPPQAVLTTALTGSDNDLTYTARTGGPWGNSIQIEYIVSGTNTALSVDVMGFLISVTVATDGGGSASSLASEIETAVEANQDASRLVTIENATSNDGSGIVTALTATNLDGGGLGTANPTPVTSDATNGHYFTDNDGQIILFVENIGTTPETVTVYYSPNLQQVAVIDPHVEDIAAGDIVRMGPFSQAFFNQTLDRDVYFDPSVSASLEFTALRVVKL